VVGGVKECESGDGVGVLESVRVEIAEAVVEGDGVCEVERKEVDGVQRGVAVEKGVRSGEGELVGAQGEVVDVAPPPPSLPSCQPPSLTVAMGEAESNTGVRVEQREEEREGRRELEGAVPEGVPPPNKKELEVGEFVRDCPFEGEGGSKLCVESRVAKGEAVALGVPVERWSDAVGGEEKDWGDEVEF